MSVFIAWVKTINLFKKDKKGGNVIK